MRTNIDSSRALDERDTLLSFLAYYRNELIRQCDGLSDEQARTTSVPPSDLNLMGLIRHMAEVERYWFRQVLVNEDVKSIWSDEAHPTGDKDGDIHATSSDTSSESIVQLRAEISIADVNIAKFELDDMAARDAAFGGTGVPNVRWILAHMIEEYARHCGHADLIRECIDGRKAD